MLREQNQTYGCGPRTSEHIEAVEREQACAVVTGQQAGLFSGPLYTIYKALTAIKLAERLTRNGPGKYVPVFWLASDDHDLAEIDHIVLLDKDNRLEEVRCGMPSGEPRIPASALVLPPEISDCLRRLADLTSDSEFKADIFAALSEAYRPGRGWVEAFARWMTRLFPSQRPDLHRRLRSPPERDGRRGLLSRNRRRVRDDSAGPRRFAETSGSRIRRPGSPA